MCCLTSSRITALWLAVVARSAGVYLAAYSNADRLMFLKT
jgi:hypothetical protein